MKELATVFTAVAMVTMEAIDKEYEILDTGMEEAKHRCNNADDTTNNKEEEVKMAGEKKEKTVQDIIDSMTEEQKTVLYAMVGSALGIGAKDLEQKLKNFATSNGLDVESLTSKYGSLTEALNAGDSALASSAAQKMKMKSWK